MLFVNQLWGVRREQDFTCIPPDGEVFTHNYSYPPAFSCNSANIRQMSQREREKTKKRQIHIWCDRNGAAHSKYIPVPVSKYPQSFTDDSSRECLMRYIEQHCRDEYPVPNVIHFIWFGNHTLDFRQFLSLYSVVTITKARLIIIHGDPLTPGKFWDALFPHALNLVHVLRAAPMYVQGRRVEKRGNQADIARIQILQEYGGVYLDTDESLLRPVDIFRAVGFAVSVEGNGSRLANGVMFARPDHEIAKIWLKNYESYDGKNWLSHSIIYLSTLAKQYPDLLQVIGSAFLTFNYRNTEKLYLQECQMGDVFGQHFFRRDYPANVDLNYVKTAPTTFGRLARYILFNDAKLCT
ncbi:uncharacterized protein LOC101848658 [Aplysia californica]|uniref:Uncharacterized protein LOC101848658 n=1 Tax=Aplysia californica TaxID=6500 RepID=A0ABM0JN58_APLCA|nr:uncharacterized protein LOC101848658 [Aplysia californica]